MRIKGLVFDMDGTMFATETISLAAMKYAAEKHGASITDDIQYSFMGLPSAEIRRRFLLIFGEAFDYDAYLADKIAFQNAVIEREGVPMKPGLTELLSYAKQEGIRCAVATSTSKMRATDLITRAGLLHIFDAILCGDAIENGKPAPDIFIAAAKEIGLNPENCMGIEDSRNGIFSVHRSGMLSVLIPDLIEPDAEMQAAADLQFESLFEVIHYLETNQ